MRIATVNVNGIRAAARKGFREWLAATEPDVLLLQEVRAPEDIARELVGDGYQTWFNPSVIAGRAGVGSAVRCGIAVGEVRSGLPSGIADWVRDAEQTACASSSRFASLVCDAEVPVDTGRWLEVDLPEVGDGGLTVISAYLHSGAADKSEKMAAKYAHLDRVSIRLAELALCSGAQGEADCSVVDSAASSGSSVPVESSGESSAPVLPYARPSKHVLMAGDFNIVHTERDITNWKSNHNKTSGVLDQEIAYLDRWFGELGFVDVQRSLMGDTQADYTWWSNRGQAFDKNVGWRIDYQITDSELAALATRAEVHRAQSYAERWSDHAPLVIEYEI